VVLADRLLRNRINKLVWQFRSSEPDFHQKYQVARSIVNPPTNGNVEATIVSVSTAGSSATAKAA